MYRQNHQLSFTRKQHTRIILFAMTAALFLLSGILYTRQASLQHAIAGKILRFHVLANSDSAEDQSLKLKVRDAVGGYLSDKAAGADNLSDCEKIIDDNLDAVIAVAEQTIRQEGYSYKVTASRETTSFPAKTYGAYTFPAGDYEALRIVIGAGEGHNWWCVMYPNLCFSGSMYEIQNGQADQKLREILTPEEFQSILSTGNYKIQSKYMAFLNPYLEKLYDN